jgi:hypothetical protein
MADGSGFTMSDDPPLAPWGDPDMAVMRLNRRPPPPLPMQVFGDAWTKWMTAAAEAAGCPVDYVAAPLLAAASALIGNARWPQATAGWIEPPHLWLCAVGDSGTGKSPGADCLMRDVLPEIERRMQGDFPDRLREWQLESEIHLAKREVWKAEVREANKKSNAPPQPPADIGPAPEAPRLRQNDVTIEKVAALLATAAPKGLLIVRDELAGWLLGMNAYNDAGRAFWIEAYGGRPYRVERQKHPEPIEVRRLAVAVSGGTQPDKLAELFKDADDGLFARLGWFWPDAKRFRIARQAPSVGWATEALDRLRMLELTAGLAGAGETRPVLVPLVDEAVGELEAFAQDAQDKQALAGGLMRSALGKARGLVLRVALVLEYLWWCGKAGMEPPPATISKFALHAAMAFVADYLIPMAERVFGDAAITPMERNAATLARWIAKEKPAEVHVRHLLREARLPGLTKAEAIHDAAGLLIDADWLRHPPKVGGKRPRAAYPVNPAIREGCHEPVG